MNIETANARCKTKAVICVECDEFERVSVAAPGANIVVWPVTVVVVHFGEHVLGKTVDIELALDLFVLSVVFACKICTRNAVYKLLVIAS